MLTMSLPWWEFIVRGVVVYIFMILLMRIGGRKQIGQLSPFDFVLLLIISNAVQNSMNGGDNSLVGGIIIAAALVCVNWAVGYINFKNKKLSHIIEGRPEIFIHNGKLHQEILIKNNISNDDLQAILRKNNIAHAEDVRYGVLEVNGDISLIRK